MLAPYKFKKLLEPIQIGPFKLRNRVVSSATYSAMAENGLFTEQAIYYYTEKAKGGVALIITEELAVHPSTALGLYRNVKAYDSNAIKSFQALSDSIHRYGAYVIGQLWHGGIHVLNKDPHGQLIQPAWAVSSIPSVVMSDGYSVPKEMSIEEIHEIQEGYVKSAQNLLKGGFDGVEIHSSHGYLPQQFLSPLYNKRNDKYGGSFENRLRFLLEIIEMLYEVTKNKKILGIRLVGDELFQGGLTLEDTKKIATILDSTEKIDYLNITHGSIQHNVHLNVPPMYYEQGFLVYLAATIKRYVKRAKVFAVGRITNPIQADEIISRGDADLVVMTRAIIADPELVNKCAEGKLDDIIPCIGCNQACLGHVLNWGIPISCILNPATGREKLWGIGTLLPTIKRKRVLVIGGGPAGCEFSIIAAKRGHDITLIEKDNELGGQVRLASQLPGRNEFALAINYWKTQLQKLGVKIILNKEINKLDEVNIMEYDAVVVATGSVADKSGFSPIYSTSILGIENNEIVCSIDEILTIKKQPGQKVMIYDDQGDIKGISLAEMLASQGREVEVVSRLSTLGQFLDVMTRVAAQIRAFEKGVKFTPDNVIKKIDGNEITLMNVYSTKESKRKVDTLILVTWRKANNHIYYLIKNSFKGEVYLIGDALSPRSVEEAVYEGYKLGREI